MRCPMTLPNESERLSALSDYGFDDIASCITYLCKTKAWQSELNRNGTVAKVLDNTIGIPKPATMAVAIQTVEDKGLHRKLKAAGARRPCSLSDRPLPACPIS